MDHDWLHGPCGFDMVWKWTWTKWKKMKTMLFKIGHGLNEIDLGGWRTTRTRSMWLRDEGMVSGLWSTGWPESQQLTKSQQLIKSQLMQKDDEMDFPD